MKNSLLKRTLLSTVLSTQLLSYSTVMAGNFLSVPSKTLSKEDLLMKSMKTSNLDDFISALNLFDNLDQTTIGVRHIPLIHRVVLHGTLEMIRELLSRNVNVNNSYNGETVLMVAADRDDDCPEIIELLLARGANALATDAIIGNALSVAALNNRFNAAKILAENAPQLLNMTNVVGHTPLMSAIKTSSIEMISMLIDKNSDINYLSCYNETPLSLAIRHRRDDVVQLLLQRGASTNIKK